MSDSSHVDANALPLIQRLDALLAAARRNEATLRKFQSFELDLMACDDLAALLRLLIDDVPQRFEWDVVSLQVIDPQQQVRRFLHEARSPFADRPQLQFISDEQPLAALYGHQHRPLLGVYMPAQHLPLFRHSHPCLKSVALLPLARSQQWMGSLNLASYRAERFAPDAATDFLQHLAAVISVCLETVISHEHMKHLGLTDPLTGVSNRRYFDQRLKEEVARTRRSGTALSCLFVDVDHFKQVNDAHGHAAGDEVLRGAAGLIREQLRSVDVVARYGGEEFAVLVADADMDRAMEVAGRIRGGVEAGLFAVGNDVSLKVTVSVGVATLGADQAAAEADTAGAQLLARADVAVYAAKRAGRNCVVPQT